MKRRQFIAGLGSAAVWPVVVQAQQAAVPVSGLLQIGAPSSWDFTGFRHGLKDMGYVEGQNLAMSEVRWANNDPDRLRCKRGRWRKAIKETWCPLIATAVHLLPKPTHVASWSACHCQLEAGR